MATTSILNGPLAAKDGLCKNSKPFDPSLNEAGKLEYHVGPKILCLHVSCLC